MGETSDQSPAPAPPGGALRRWTAVVVAAVAMVATLPGRTHGLGLVTKPLLTDLDLGQVPYAAINLWATLLGAVFCVPWGWLIDRLGYRSVLAITLAALGAVVVQMSRVQGHWLVTVPVPFGEPMPIMMDLFLLVLLTRGLGQSALSVVSLATIGHASGRRPGPAVAVYSVLVSIGFMAAFSGVGYSLKTLDADWRTVWAGIGVALLVLAPLAWIVLMPARAALPGAGGPTADDGPSLAEHSFSLLQALLSPAFWVFALAISFYGLIQAGVSLFGEFILKERGFDRDVFYKITAITPMIGLAANLTTGWLATRWPMNRLLAAAMALLAAALFAFPLVQTLLQVYLYAATLGSAGGMITVLFFAVWRKAFGPANLGKIQGAAQLLTVLASALGPLLLAEANRRTGSYTLIFQAGGAVSIVFALASFFTPVPQTVVVPEPVDSPRVSISGAATESSS
jgi:MFS family permease